MIGAQVKRGGSKANGGWASERRNDRANHRLPHNGREERLGHKQGLSLCIQVVVLHFAEEDRWRNMETLTQPRDVVAVQSTLAGKNQ